MHRSASLPSARRLLPFALVGAVAAMACDENDQVSTPNRRSASPVVIISPKAAVLNAGGTRQFTAEVRAPNGSVMNVPVRFESGDTTIVRVTASGNATAVGDGVASVIAYIDEGARTSASVAVIPTNVASVQISGFPGLLSVGSARQLTAQAFDAAGNPIPGTFTWTSSAPSIASVNEAGVVIGAGEGPVTVTATAGGASATFNFTSAFLTQTLTLSPASPATIAQGTTQQFTGTPRDGAGNVIPGRTVVWSTRANPPGAQNVCVASSWAGSISQDGQFTLPAGRHGSNVVTGSVTDLGGTVTSTVLVNPLVSGQTVTGISGLGNGCASQAGTTVYNWLVNVPAGTTQLQVVLTAQPGQDADVALWTPAGAFVCAPFSANGVSETCTVANPAAGLWRVEVAGWNNFTDWSLRATLTPAP